MTILLTNDDGIESPGIQILKKILGERHDTWLFAPDGERSGTSHSITLRDAVRVVRRGEQEFSCSGTPADCVMFSLLGALPVIPDIIISGINIGPNLGTDVIYSGTAAAAREAALNGKPGIAVSLAAKKQPLHLDYAADFLLGNLELLITLWSPEHFININVPNIQNGNSPIEITHPSRRIYHDRAVHFDAPDGSSYYFLEGLNTHADYEENTDWHAISKNRISVSPVFLHPINHHEDMAYHAASFKVPEL